MLTLSQYGRLSKALMQSSPDVDSIQAIVREQAGTEDGVSPILSGIAQAMLTEDPAKVLLAVHEVRAVVPWIPIMYNDDSRLALTAAGVL